MKRTCVLFLLWTFFNYTWGNCPLPVTPCNCRSIKNGILLECNGLEEPDRAWEVLQNITGRQSFEIQLEALNVENLPSTLLQASAIRLRQCSLGRLLRNPPLAWTRLSEVVLESVSIRDNLWPYLKEARLLRYLKIKAFHMPVIGAEFRYVPKNVAYLELKKTETALMDPGSMRHLTSLKYLQIVDVPLKEFPRDVLPENMPQFHTFILGNTNIESLESSFFEGMPNLEVLMLSGNKFSALDYQTFAPLTHLTHLLAERNPLKCQCSLKWMKDKKKKFLVKVLATCYDSITQEAKEVTTLNESEYC